MLLTELAVQNYKSFHEEVRFHFGTGFNILLGANSSGKTTVLEAIRFRELPSIPHRSIENITERDIPWTEPSRVSARFDLSLAQIQKLIQPSRELVVALCDADSAPIATNELIDNYWQTNPLTIEFFQRPGHSTEAQFHILGKPSITRLPNRELPVLRANVPSSGLIVYTEGASRIIGNDTLTDINDLANVIHSRTYRFAAERVSRASSGPSSDELSPDASNLAYCINHLNSNDPATYDQLNKYIHRIFPNIHGISAVPTSQGTFEIKVHTLSRNLKRSDLAVPLDRVGTGVTNALAMLYVVLTAHTPRIILLEEPNSYLHPRALRDLLSIVAEAGSMHQFFITTHSSDVLRSVPSHTVTLLEHNGVKTSARQTMQKDLSDFHTGLLDLGIRLTDLHGCDRVLWVEGETEEAIFPKILAHFFKEIAQGIATLRLHATGDFEARAYRASKVAEIYRRLSSATFLAPPMVAITLDREGKQPSEIDRLIREGKGILHFLPQPMIENYLLLPEAISSVLNSYYACNTTSQDVQDSIARAINDPGNRINPRNHAGSPPHAAKVLGHVFVELGGSNADYKKTTHGPMIADWILINQPEAFQELKTWLATFVDTERESNRSKHT